MNRKHFALTSFLVLALAASPAYACELGGFQLIVYMGGIGFLTAIPYFLVSALVLAFKRNRWLNGSWKLWFKHSLLSFVLAGLGLGLGASTGVILMHLRNLGLMASEYEVFLYFALIGTTPLVVLATQFMWLKDKAAGLQVSLNKGWDLALGYLGALALLSTAAFAIEQSLSESLAIAAITYVLISAFVLAYLRERWLNGSWSRWARQTMISAIVAGLGFGVGSIFLAMELSIRSGFPYFSTAAMFTTPIVFLVGQFLWLKTQSALASPAEAKSK